MDLGGGATTAAAIWEANRAGLRNGERLCAKRSNMFETALPSISKLRWQTLCADPWGARDEYINLLLDRKNHLAPFLEKHLRGGPRSSNVSRFLELLEMQRFSLLMFTSCGWFFDEISQLESVLILKYAAMAIRLAEKTGSPPLEPGVSQVVGAGAQ